MTTEEITPERAQARSDIEAHIEQEALRRFQADNPGAYVTIDFRAGTEFAATVAVEMLEAYFRHEKIIESEGEPTPDPEPEVDPDEVTESVNGLRLGDTVVVQTQYVAGLSQYHNATGEIEHFNSYGDALKVRGIDRWLLLDQVRKDDCGCGYCRGEAG